MRNKNFRKRALEQDPSPESEDEEERRLALEEVKLLQKQRERKLGIPAGPAVKSGSSGLQRSGDKGEGDGEKEDLVLQDTFAQETAVTVEDPNMLEYVEQELARRRGKSVDSGDKEEKDQVDELYVVPEHLKVKKRNSEESSTQWTTGIAEIQLPIEYKLRNIEETEAAKKLLQEKRLAGKTKSELTIPSSFSADYFQRGRDYAEKLRRGGKRAGPHLALCCLSCTKSHFSKNVMNEIIQNCTRIEMHRLMRWEPSQQNPTTQTSPPGGKLQQMNSCLNVSANENDIVFSADSTR